MLVFAGCFFVFCWSTYDYSCGLQVSGILNLKKCKLKFTEWWHTKITEVDEDTPLYLSKSTGSTLMVLSLACSDGDEEASSFACFSSLLLYRCLCLQLWGLFFFAFISSAKAIMLKQTSAQAITIVQLLETKKLWCVRNQWGPVGLILIDACYGWLWSAGGMQHGMVAACCNCENNTKTCVLAVFCFIRACK